jgi:hypothetical protein
MTESILLVPLVLLVLVVPIPLSDLLLLPFRETTIKSIAYLLRCPLLPASLMMSSLPTIS